MLNICDVIQLDTEIYTKLKQSLFLSKIRFFISLLSSIHPPFIFLSFFFFYSMFIYLLVLFLSTFISAHFDLETS